MIAFVKVHFGKQHVWKLITLEKFNSGNDCFVKVHFGKQQVWNVHGPSRPPYLPIQLLIDTNPIAHDMHAIHCTTDCQVTLTWKMETLLSHSLSPLFRAVPTMFSSLSMTLRLQGRQQCQRH